MPTGSYTETCQNCYINDCQLVCQCMKPRFKPQMFTVSSLHLFPCRNQEVYNNKGQLDCLFSRNCKMPTGSYLETCNHCDLKDCQLECSCEANNNDVTNSTLNLLTCANDILHNDNGNLICAKYEITHTEQQDRQRNAYHIT
eukprot:UN27844